MSKRARKKSEAAESVRTAGPGITFIMTVGSRVRYFEQYAQEGLLDGMPLLLVDDGLGRESSLQLRATAGLHHVPMIRHDAPLGPLQAFRSGVEHAEGSLVMVIRECDYLLGMEAFGEEVMQKRGGSDEVLFSLVPSMLTLNEASQALYQEDRRSFDGMTGQALLAHLVEEGEAGGLAVGALFDREATAGLLPGSGFAPEAELLLLARLCGRYPGRTVHVPVQGRYMRLEPEHPLTTRSGYSLERAVMNLVALGVGGSYLIEQGAMKRAALREALHRRGYNLQESHGLGAQAAAVVGALVAGRREEILTREAHQTLGLLKRNLASLPGEFLDLIGVEGQRWILGATNIAPLFPGSRGRVAEGREGVIAPPARLFVGGGPHAGAELLQQVLCRAEAGCEAVPSSQYLRGLLHVYRQHAGKTAAPVPASFDDMGGFSRFHGGIVRSYLERLNGLCSSSGRPVLCDVALTPYFPALAELDGEARLVCMVRDPRDAVASMMAGGGLPSDDVRTDFLAKAVQERDVSRLCRHYRSFYAPLLASNDAYLWERTLVVRFEDLLERGGVQRLRAFAGLALAAWPAGGVTLPASVLPVGGHTQVLTLREIQHVEAECVDLFELFGYHPRLRAAA